MPLTRSGRRATWMDLFMRVDAACWALADAGKKRQAARVARAWRKWSERSRPRAFHRHAELIDGLFSEFIHPELMKGG